MMSDTWDRIVAHADMDAFYASVEQLDDPNLRGKPILVGPQSRRGVVLTASYEARPFGVGSAMPMVKALRLCPDAIVVPPRFDRYTELSVRIMQSFEEFSPSVEALSLDEAFLDMSVAEQIFGEPQRMGTKIQAAVRDATGGLTVSVGIAQTKFVAKVASGFAKPDGLTVVSPGHEVAWLAPMSVARLWGAGPKTQARLKSGGYHTIGNVAAADLAELQEQFGKLGLHFFELAHARDPRPVETGRKAQSIGSERTLERDISDEAEIRRHLRRSADRVARRLRNKAILAGGVSLRMKTADFRLLTRQCTLARPTDTAEEIFSAACALLRRLDDPGPFRLVGLAAQTLRPRNETAQLSLLDEPDDARNLEATLDQLADRYGDGIVKRARDLSRSLVNDDAPNLDFVSTPRDSSRR
jgi:DNA polymerase-4